MLQIKVKLLGKGTPEEPWTVFLPAWTMVGEPDHQKKECFVSVPDDELMIENGKIKINQGRIREKYKKGWGHFDASEVMVKDR